MAWRGGKVCAISFPMADDGQVIASLRRCCGDVVAKQPSAALRNAITQVDALLAGEDIDLTGIAFDLGDATAFERSVYAKTSKIRRGKTRTYGEIAKTLGDPQAARAVGRALGRNPVPIIVPCHRVLASGGKTGGFSGAGGRTTKLRLLQIEGATFGDEPSLFNQADNAP